jgi:hypothetical protein
MEKGLKNLNQAFRSAQKKQGTGNNEDSGYGISDLDEDDHSTPIDAVPDIPGSAATSAQHPIDPPTPAGNVDLPSSPPIPSTAALTTSRLITKHLLYFSISLFLIYLIISF